MSKKGKGGGKEAEEPPPELVEWSTVLSHLDECVALVHRSDRMRLTLGGPPAALFDPIAAVSGDFKVTYPMQCAASRTAALHLLDCPPGRRGS